jgi:hypothetical protein
MTERHTHSSVLGPALAAVVGLAVYVAAAECLGLAERLILVAGFISKHRLRAGRDGL